MQLAVGALVTFIVTTIVTESYLFGPVRRAAQAVSRHLGVLFGCFLCFGTWVGFGVAFLAGGPLERWYIDGLAFQAIAFLVHALVGLIDDIRQRLQL